MKRTFQVFLGHGVPRLGGMLLNVSRSEAASLTSVGGHSRVADRVSISLN